MGLLSIYFIANLYFFKIVLRAQLVNLSHDKKKKKIFNTKYHKFLENDKHSFIFTTPILRTTSPTISTKNILLYMSLISSHYSILTFNNIILTIPANTSFLYTPATFHLPLFAYNHPVSLHQKNFLYLNQLATSGCAKGQRSYGVLWRMTLF